MKAGRWAAAVLVVMAVIAQPVSANDHDASDPPTVSGPLIGADVPCEDSGSPGRGMAHMQSCSWLYDLIPAETNPTEDFSAFWFQAEIDPGPGWCAKEISFDLGAPSDGRIVSASPAEGGRIPKSRSALNELSVDAEGAAPVPGHISQEVVLTPGRTKVELNENRYHYVWRGNSRSKVVIAVGVQLAHGRIPPELIYMMMEGEGASWGACRPMVIRIHSE